MKLRLKPRKPKGFTRVNRRVLGESIEFRPEIVDARTTFGHWEIDTVIGQKLEKDQVLLALVGRKSRYEIIMKIDGKQRQNVDKALSKLIEEIEDLSSRVFKSITSDNDPEFSGLSEYLKRITDVYFTHPYSSK